MACRSNATNHFPPTLGLTECIMRIDQRRMVPIDIGEIVNIPVSIIFLQMISLLRFPVVVCPQMQPIDYTSPTSLTPYLQNWSPEDGRMSSIPFPSLQESGWWDGDEGSREDNCQLSYGR